MARKERATAEGRAASEKLVALAEEMARKKIEERREAEAQAVAVGEAQAVAQSRERQTLLLVGAGILGVIVLAGKP